MFLTDFSCLEWKRQFLLLPCVLKLHDKLDPHHLFIFNVILCDLMCFSPYCKWLSHIMKVNEIIDWLDTLTKSHSLFSHHFTALLSSSRQPGLWPTSPLEPQSRPKQWSTPVSSHSHFYWNYALWRKSIITMHWHQTLASISGIKELIIYFGRFWGEIWICRFFYYYY